MIMEMDAKRGKSFFGQMESKKKFLINGNPKFLEWLKDYLRFWCD